MDRALAYEVRGRRFESFRAHHLKSKVESVALIGLSNFGPSRAKLWFAEKSKVEPVALTAKDDFGLSVEPAALTANDDFGIQRFPLFARNQAANVSCSISPAAS